ncbi:MAG: hypothetical protein ACLFNS_01625 [Desulfobacterales bacterium]
MNPSPVFRKAIVAWYDTNAVCIGVLVLMAAVLVFGIEGIRVAGTIEKNQNHVWVPILLVVLSGCVCLSILFRMIRRYRNRFSL